MVTSKKEKQWKPKTKPPDETVVANVTAPPNVHTSHEVINETGVTNAVVTPKEDQLKINEEDKGDIWTRVSKPTRDRGKRKIYTGSTSDVNCMSLCSLAFQDDWPDSGMEQEVFILCR